VCRAPRCRYRGGNGWLTQSLLVVEPSAALPVCSGDSNFIPDDDPFALGLPVRLVVVIVALSLEALLLVIF
jgi:hypothetical protein